ncbi:L,D-transpeptidase family protein [Rhizobium alvei]|uniref:L,D-transpeptidase family protein n=1 Tax=Rhizobium alvei TaxID=1132659 RepID=A0ABT8YJ67_9HYPH|nr:L,D-transpeptidase family protein [Rhizobium alvei]MDO6963710.1 L,D-transpeptidase family protein [Rhizobium alvei]
MLVRLTASLALASTVLFGTGARAAEDLNPLQIFVSKDTQSLVVYEGDRVVTTSNVSTGKSGHTTPSGIFSILEKRKTHFSNLYDSAPMPWMQRLTWSGVALHESRHVPRYPASHGCVRMPAAFAKQLFGMTQRGFHVVITDAEVQPRRIATDGLLMPRYPSPPADLMSDAELRPTMSADSKVELASAEALPKAGAIAVAELPKAEPPVRILITRENDGEKRKQVEAFLDRLSYEPGPVDGKITKQSQAAIKSYQELHGLKTTGTITAEFTRSIYRVMNHAEPTGRIYVRRNFKPVFDAPIAIAEPEKALGTHFYQALNVNTAQNSADWFAVTLANHVPEKTMARLGITLPADDGPQAAEATFARIAISADLRARLEPMLGNGSSITITDTGTESETGQGTDFITILKKGPANAG